MNRSSVTNRFARPCGLIGFALIHAIHVAILLLPSLILAGPSQFDRPIVAFAILVAIAAALESHFVQPRFNVDSACIQDASAIRVASIVGVLLLFSFWSAQLEHFALHFNSLVIQFVGILAAAAGILLRIQAIRTLGPAFQSDICVGPNLIEHGIYRWLAHPSEIGLLMIAIGCPAILCSPYTAIAIAVTLAPMSAWRINRENGALSASRGSQ